MANNHSIQLLRKAGAPTSTELSDLFPGQPLYDMTNNKLYIGNGSGAKLVNPDVPIPETVPLANATQNGLMGSSDYTKLQGIESGAQKNTVTSVAGMTGDITLTKTNVGLANVDNIQQYSASNPPPYPVTGVKGSSESSYRTGCISLSAANVGAVPTTRTVNSKALSSDITLTASDVGARDSTWVPSYDQISGKPSIIMHNFSGISRPDINLTLNINMISNVEMYNVIGNANNTWVTQGNFALSAQHKLEDLVINTYITQTNADVSIYIKDKGIYYLPNCSQILTYIKYTEADDSSDDFSDIHIIGYPNIN